jgi:hypothetical protein
MKMIAEQELTARFPDGRINHVSVRIGAPTARSGGEWACEVHLAGLPTKPDNLRCPGEGSWHALMMGIKFVQIMLSEQVDRGVVFYWPDSDEVADLDLMFGHWPPTKPSTEHREIEHESTDR